MRLSICIATYNRARFIGETLDSIIAQLRPDVEIVVVDGASPDDTAAVMDAYGARCPAVRYFRETTNSGVDGDYDKAVQYARGEHCWLLPDDDLLAPCAVDRVLQALEDGAVDLLIVDAEVRDASLTRRLRAGRLRLRGERRYGRGDADALLGDAGYALSFIGVTIVRKSLWMSRSRQPYLGSLFIHVGVIFQPPAIRLAKVLAEPLVIIRAGNSMWKPRAFEIWAFMWPSLIWSFEDCAAAAKERVTRREPWRDIVWLLGYRALGAYSKAEYDRYLAGRATGLARVAPRLASVVPGPWANLLAVVVLALIGKGGGSEVYDMVACSRYSNRASRFLAGFWLGRLNPPAF